LKYFLAQDKDFNMNMTLFRFFRQEQSQQIFQAFLLVCGLLFDDYSYYFKKIQYFIEK